VQVGRTEPHWGMMVCACRRVGGFQCRKLACFLCGLEFLSVGFVLEDVLFCVDTMGEV